MLAVPVKIPLLLSVLLLALPAPAQPPSSFAYVLQADSLAKSRPEAVAKLAACGRDWLVLDANFTTGEPWTTNDIAAIREAKPGRKILSYISIGEAGDYRDYWQRAWDADKDGKPDAGAPSFLLAENPQWKGDYRVKYWQPAWQQLILADVDRIMAAGFDGLYLDIVDGFETFERDGEKYLDDRLNPETKQTYRRDMVDWVKAVAARARKANPAAMVIPQNGTQLFAHADFLATADGSGVEDLFTNGNKTQAVDEIKFRLDTLAPVIAAHKPVLDIEYARKAELQARVKQQASEHGFIWLVTDRQLKTLGTSGK
jgi:cysteinyl-tRNA synthetase